MSVRSSRAIGYRIVKLCPLVLISLAFGCAGPMGTIRSEAVVPTVTAFDGSYRNTIRVTGSTRVAQGTDWCQTPGQPTITVANGGFTYEVSHPNVPGNATTTFPATMAQDGSFAGQTVDGTISGRVNGTHIEGNIDGGACLYAFTGERV
jgi:hypothetical protein